MGRVWTRTVWLLGPGTGTLSRVGPELWGPPAVLGTPGREAVAGGSWGQQPSRGRGLRAPGGPTGTVSWGGSTGHCGWQEDRGCQRLREQELRASGVRRQESGLQLWVLTGSGRLPGASPWSRGGPVGQARPSGMRPPAGPATDTWSEAAAWGPARGGGRLRVSPAALPVSDQQVDEHDQAHHGQAPEDDAQQDCVAAG